MASGGRGVSSRRMRLLSPGVAREGAVAYWMSRDQRASDNWALLFAQDLALQARVPLHVVFCLAPAFLGATARHYDFLLRGLAEVEQALRVSSIGFDLLFGDPEDALPPWLAEQGIAQLVTDFDPLRLKRRWKSGVLLCINIPAYEVDAHNIIPCLVASAKQEYGARTLRPKLQRLLPEFMDPFPELRQHPFAANAAAPTDWGMVRARLRLHEDPPPVSWLAPGEAAAARALRTFLERRLAAYDVARNDPNRQGQSDLSPYLHFGQLSAQRVAMTVRAAPVPEADQAAFPEELIVRRELSDNYCYYNKEYDSFVALPSWAQKTLNDHRADPRPYLYTDEQLTTAETHDDLWNAAQMELIRRGKMHGYLRMYWAKKILEWSKSPERAMQMAILLNDRYSLDGCDPNGYAGIAWSIGGVHDRPWPQRSVFGTIRYMSYEGCKRKFSVPAYVARIAAAFAE